MHPAMTQSTPKLDGVPRTMLFTLKGRADEQHRLVPLFSDPLAVEWSKVLPMDDSLGEFYNWAYQNFLAIRAAYHDRIASAHIASHSQPVVVELGAGMSSRYHRIGSNVYRWFDLDLPVVTDLRRQLDTQTEQHQLIGSSVLDFSWMDAMPEVPPENFLFIAEGLLMYLPASDVQQIVDKMRSRFPGATLLMDVLGNVAQLAPGKNKLDRLGAPFKWYVEDEAEIAAMGLSPVKVASLPQLCPERWPFPFRLITWLPTIRNSYRIVEATIEPLR